MAPGRKRGGATGAMANNQLKPGDLVLAKVKGFPAWPAKISKPEDWKQTPDARKYFVHFFGTEEIAFVAPVDIKPFTRESKDKLLTRCKGKTVKYFSQAVKEICDTFEELESKSPDSLTDGNSGHAFQPDANSMELVDDGLITDGPSCAASSNDIVPHSPGLERCSQIHREMGHEDVQARVSPLVNDRFPPPSNDNQAEFCNDDMTSSKAESISTSGAGHNINSKARANVETNRQKHKKTAKAQKNNHDLVDEMNNILSPVKIGSLFQTSHIESSITGNSKDGTQRSASHMSKNEVTVGVTNSESGDNVRKANKTLKDRIHAGLTDDLLKDVEGTRRDLVKDDVSSGVLHPVKKPKFSDDARKKSHMLRKSDVSSKGGDEEVKKSKLNLKTKNPLVFVGQTFLGDEDVQPTKRRRLVLEDASEDRTTESSITPKKGENTYSVKSKTQVHMKRRAVRIFDEDDDEDGNVPKTPMHGRSSEVVEKVSHTSVSIEEVAVVTEAVQESPGANKRLHIKESMPKSRQDIVEAVEGKLLHTPLKAEPEKKSSEETAKVSVSRAKSPLDAYSQMIEPFKVNKTLGKSTGNISQKKGQLGSSKTPIGIYEGGHRSQKTAVNERIETVISGEKKKITPKTTSKSCSRIIDSAAVLRKPSDSNLLSSERSEFRVAQTTSSSGSKNADSNKSMKHLIAVAQAKRKQAQAPNLVHESLKFSHPEVIGKNLGSISPFQPTTGSGVVAQTDDQLGSTESERGTSSGHRPAGGSLSGGTEAAVARDAFEGMLETLSRTRDSIGRATRHAIDCAKHGIANEIVELLIRKLENESSFRRRVDIFFLVDSITQCSHSRKGIAGASYIPNVQAALPRLLVAAAPPGANARENRRQCLKVLKLWRDRKILPDTLLRSYIEDIGSSKNNTSAVSVSKRPSRSERAVDDPLREMEGMFDEYGSNATFQLPGLLSCHVFEEEDEIINFSHREGNCKSSPATVEIESCSVTSNEKRHRSLEEVDGELEMEDVSGHQKEEQVLTGDGSCKVVQEDGDGSCKVVQEDVDGSCKVVQKDVDASCKVVQEDDEGSNRALDAVSNNSDAVSPLREGSPPLPPDSPPPTPPLPSSPLSPLIVPPPPSTPSPPPPPPPPVDIPQQTYPLPGGPPQVLFSQLPVQSVPSIVSLTSRLGASADSAEMLPQQLSSLLRAVPTSSGEPSVFTPSGIVGFGHETYTAPQGSQSHQQHQALLPIPRTLQTLMLSRVAAGQLQYPNSAMMQHPYSLLYGLTKPPAGPRRYGVDEQWRPPSNEFNSDSLRGLLMSNAHSSLSAVSSFAREAYFGPSIERARPTNSPSFQPVGQNIISNRAPVIGRRGLTMKPPLNSWRPA